MTVMSSMEDVLRRRVGRPTAIHGPAAGLPVPSPSIIDSPTWCLHTSIMHSQSALRQGPAPPAAASAARQGLHAPAWPVPQPPPEQ